MSNPLLLDMITYLTNKGAVKGDGVDAFRDFTPDKPDDLVALIEYAGSPTLPYEELGHRSVQVTVRNKDADVARQKALEIFKLFQSDSLVVAFTPERWGQVSLRQLPFRLSTDSNNRITYAFNMGVTTTIE